MEKQKRKSGVHNEKERVVNPRLSCSPTDKTGEKQFLLRRSPLRIKRDSKWKINSRGGREKRRKNVEEEDVRNGKYSEVQRINQFKGETRKKSRGEKFL
jgi:hypothetical protein